MKEVPKYFHGRSPISPASRACGMYLKVYFVFNSFNLCRFKAMRAFACVAFNRPLVASTWLLWLVQRLGCFTRTAKAQEKIRVNREMELH